MGPKMHQNLFAGIALLGNLFQTPISGCILSVILVSFFWLTFGSLLLFLGSFFFSLALFWCLFESFYSFSRFLHRFLLIPRDFARIYNDFLSITAQPLQVIVWTLAFACAHFSEARCGDIAVGNWDPFPGRAFGPRTGFFRIWGSFFAIENS